MATFKVQVQVLLTAMVGGETLKQVRLHIMTEIWEHENSLRFGVVYFLVFRRVVDTAAVPRQRRSTWVS